MHEIAIREGFCSNSHVFEIPIAVYTVGYLAGYAHACVVSDSELHLTVKLMYERMKLKVQFHGNYHACC